MAHKTTLAAMGGLLAVIPAGLASGGAENWTSTTPADNLLDIGPVQGAPPEILQVSVNGELPKPPEPAPAEELPSGPLGIPGTALKAYRHAADLMAAEQPGCHIDWALIASIGRIESNHARGGYVDANGTTREPILGPQLNGVGPVAAIRDSDGGRWDRDTVWDRAVGPTQFIPTTWNFYGVDGNNDGVADPNNIYDATLASARYLCSGGLDLADPAQLRAAIYRYNNSDAYVETVIRWAEAYRNGVALLPDSEVPIGAPSATAVPTPPPVTPPPTILAAPPPVTTPTSPSGRTDLTTTTATTGSSITTTTITTTTTTTSEPPVTSPTCESTTSPTAPTTTTPTSETLPPCAPPTSTAPTSAMEPTTGANP